MVNWIDSFTGFLLISSALLLALGGVSCLIVQVFKIRGKARLLICSMLIIMPMAYPIGTLLPDHIKILLPLEGVQSFYFQQTKPRNDAISKDRISLTGADKTSTDKYVLTDAQTSTPAASMPVPKRASSYSINWKLVITIAWIALFLLILVRFVIIVKKTRLLLKCADCVTDPHVLELLQQCVAETGLRRSPRTLVVDHLQTPMAVGFLHPAIILPARLLEPEFQEGLRFTLLHELKHLQRHDNWWLLIESLVSAAYFFHPVIYWAKQRIHEEWEYICDNHVIQVTNKSASYADFLLNEIWNHGREMNPSLAVPFILSAPKTTKRVYSILEKRRPTLFTKIRERFAVGLLFLSFVLVLLCSVTPSAQLKEEEMYHDRVQPTDTPGEYYVADMMDSIEKVKAAYLKSKTDSKKATPLDLTNDQWSFDKTTNLLHVKTDVDNEKQLVIIYGKQAIPWTWKLKGPLQTNSVRILIGDLTAVRGEDFEVNEEEGLIRFLKPDLCTDSTKYFITCGLKPVSGQPGTRSMSMGNLDDQAAIRRFLGLPEQEDEDPVPSVPNSVGTNATPIEPPYLFGLVQPVEEYGMKIALSKEGQRGLSKWLTKIKDYTYDENTGIITMKEPIPEGYQQDYLFVSGVLKKDVLFLHKDIKPGSVEIAFNEGCDNEKKLKEGGGFIVNYANQTVTILDPLIKEKGTQIMIYWTDVKGGINSYGSKCNPLPEDWDYDVNYSQSVVCTAISLKTPKVFKTETILQEKGLYAYITDKDDPYHVKNLKRDKDYSYDPKTGVIHMLKDFDIDGKATQLIVTGIPLKSI